MSTTTSTVVSEKNLFLGPRIPNHTKYLYRLLPNIERNLFRKLVKLVVKDVEGKNVDIYEYDSLRKQNNSTDFDYTYGAVRFLLRCALSFPTPALKPEVFRADLRELRINEEFIDDLSDVVFGERSSADSDKTNVISPGFPKLATLSWRVDVGISTSNLSRVLEPNLLMELKFQNGENKVLEVSPSQFHKLRFSVATLLKSMEDVEMKNVMKGTRN